jgi:hypothetical protein
VGKMRCAKKIRSSNRDGNGGKERLDIIPTVRMNLKECE